MLRGHANPLGERGTIESVRFKFLSRDDASRLAVANLSSHKTMRRAMPESGGPNDPRMGSMDRRLPCSTCENGIDASHGLCIGHFAQISLVCAVFNPLTIAFGLAILR
jgi:DNA-directed RNA polymerase II subunit RPB1